jgi:SET domain-containing protein
MRPRKKNRYFELRASPIAGLGGFALRPIAKGTRIVEYVGQRIADAEADRRYDDTTMDVHHTFLFAVSKDVNIDAAVDGNDARFINHSCAPNCEAIDEDGRIYIYARRGIPEGTELTYDYRYKRDGAPDAEFDRRYFCCCGAKSCRGTMLAPPPRKRGSRRSAPKKASPRKTRR